MPNYILPVPWAAAILFLIFFIRFRKSKHSLSNGFIFISGLMLLFVWLIFVIFTIPETENPLLIKILFFVGKSLALIFIAFSILCGILLLANAIVVWKKEHHSLANSLTLMVALIFFFYPLWIRALPKVTSPEVNYFLNTFVGLSLVYVMFNFFNYLLIAVFYSLFKPHSVPDYIIVLGSGLRNGEEVTPLLGARIDKAVEIFSKVSKDTDHSPKIICSGGQGADEMIPECRAMKQYALKKGVPEQYLLEEDKSKNTLENFMFSKMFIETASKNSGNTVFFVTSNYHLLRAAILADQAELDSYGIGSKTAGYFLPNAFIREFIAVFIKFKWMHLIMWGGAALLSLYLTIEEYALALLYNFLNL